MAACLLVLCLGMQKPMTYGTWMPNQLTPLSANHFHKSAVSHHAARNRESLRRAVKLSARLIPVPIFFVVRRRLRTLPLYHRRAPRSPDWGVCPGRPRAP